MEKKRAVTVIVEEGTEVTIKPLAAKIASQPETGGLDTKGLTGTASVTSEHGSPDGDADVDYDF